MAMSGALPCLKLDGLVSSDVERQTLQQAFLQGLRTAATEEVNTEESSSASQVHNLAAAAAASPTHGIEEAFLQELRDNGIPEASRHWWQALEVLEATSVDFLPRSHAAVGEATGPTEAEGTCCRSVHIGHGAAASVYAVNQFLASGDARLQAMRRRWTWRASASNPHYEGLLDPLRGKSKQADAGKEVAWSQAADWSDLEKFLYCHTEEKWFHTQDDSGALASHNVWNVGHFWKWLTSGGSGSSVSAPTQPDPQELARRLPHAAFIWPMRNYHLQQQKSVAEHVISVIVGSVTALGILRVRGAMMLELGRLCDLEAMLPLVLCMTLLFEDVQLQVPSLGDATSCCVFLVATRFRGAPPQLLQALVVCCRKLVNGKRSSILPRSWTGLTEPIAGLRNRLDAWCSLVQCQKLELASAAWLQNARRRCWTQPLPVSLQVVPLPPEWCRSDPEVPPAKRLRRADAQSSRRWFAWDTKCPSHRQLLRLFGGQAADAAVKELLRAWRTAQAIPPDRFGHSSFTRSGLLQGPDDSQGGAASEGVHVPRTGTGEPPWLLVGLTRAIQLALPDRLEAFGAPSLKYKRFLLALPETLAEDSGAAATWLTEAMGLQGSTSLIGGSCSSSAAAKEEVRKETGTASGQGHDMVILGSFPASGSCGGGPRGAGRAALELDYKWREDLVQLVLAGLQRAVIGADFYLQLPSVYTRFVAGVVVLLAVVFERFSIVTSEDILGAFGQSRWIVFNGFSRRHHVTEVFQALLDRLRSAGSSQAVPQVLPARHLCLPGSELLDFLQAASSEVARCPSSAGGQPPSGTPKGKDASVLAALAKVGLKPFLFPRQEHRSRIGLYFGTFDPIHENHIRVAMCGLRSHKLRKVMFCPNQESNPYKPLSSSLQHRLDCLRLRIEKAEESEEVTAGQFGVRVSQGLNNWPQREQLAQTVEAEEFADEPGCVEAVILLGEDSLLKSLASAAKHKQNGIFQLVRHGSRARHLIVFPRAGKASDIESQIPDRLRHCITIADYADDVVGLSSSTLRDLRKKPGCAPPPPEAIHPALWSRLTTAGCAEPASGDAAMTSPSQVEHPAAESDCEAEEAADTMRSNNRSTSIPLDARSHWQQKQQQSLEERGSSPTVHLRNFNSFAKAVLLEQVLSDLRAELLRDDPNSGMAPLSVLDLGCGKGGDLKKFANCGVTEYCGVDVSKPSLESCVERVRLIAEDVRKAKHGSLARGLSFRHVSLICADSWREHLGPLLDLVARHGTARAPGIERTWFHVVSSQMACHLAFESRSSLEQLLANVSERLCSGGKFVATVPDSRRIVDSVRRNKERCQNLRIGNDVYEIEFSEDSWQRVAANVDTWVKLSEDQLPHQVENEEKSVFGIHYRFNLVDAVVHCSEPLVHFDTLVRMAARYGLTLHMRPTPLTDLVSQAKGDRSGARAASGRLRRIYFYKGGMDVAEEAASRELEALGFFCAIVFRKEGRGGSVALTSSASGFEAGDASDRSCAWLAEQLRALYPNEPDAQGTTESRRLPLKSTDIICTPRFS
eukprot:TRINITY_DN19706_c0_g3_i1.p1 TRINITY_DN19706_c0_g3~~TRINITY_DN19706_c0_g3_i1.p1  ORF type:complete len:1530 (+),score=327.46 TRINITY_DN19706_c0_g3_i1:71-4660(+)